MTTRALDMRPTIVSVVGARPNFMKLAPVAHALRRDGRWRHVVIHTGQHYDANLSADFFRDLALDPPDYALDVGSGSGTQQLALVMQRLEPILGELAPDWVLVYGDINSTLAAALAAAKLGLAVAHVEAGLRSRDRTMPEELNRILTDHCADLLLAPSADAVDNLVAEGCDPGCVRFVGNVMIDSLEWALPRALAFHAAERLGLAPGEEYVVVTLHRPSNVDDAARLSTVLDSVRHVALRMPVLFPLHPRTRAQLPARRDSDPGRGRLRLLEPQGYIAMLSLVAGARLVLTDSGGLQEETSYLGVPCLTVRPSTERPVTCQFGTNRLVPPGDDLLAAVQEALDSPRPRRPVIERWDGHTAERIVNALEEAGSRFSGAPAHPLDSLSAAS